MFEKIKNIELTSETKERVLFSLVGMIYIIIMIVGWAVDIHKFNSSDNTSYTTEKVELAVAATDELWEECAELYEYYETEY